MLEEDIDDKGRPNTSSGRLVVTFFEDTGDDKIEEILGRFRYERPYESVRNIGSKSVRALNPEEEREFNLFSNTYRVFVPRGQELRIKSRLEKEYGDYIERIDRPAMRYPTE